MRVNLTIILLACIASLSGQNVKVTKHYEITPSVGQSAFYPILSPDGNRIVYTSENFCGLGSRVRPDFQHRRFNGVLSAAKHHKRTCSPIFERI